MSINDVVQFNENHKWCGCLGIIYEIKECKSDMAPNGDIRFTIGVPAPMEGTAFIYVMASEFAIEKIGTAKLVLGNEDNNDVCS